MWNGFQLHTKLSIHIQINIGWRTPTISWRDQITWSNFDQWPQMDQKYGIFDQKSKLIFYFNQTYFGTFLVRGVVRIYFLRSNFGERSEPKIFYSVKFFNYSVNFWRVVCCKKVRSKTVKSGVKLIFAE